MRFSPQRRAMQKIRVFLLLHEGLHLPSNLGLCCFSHEKTSSRWENINASQYQQDLQHTELSPAECCQVCTWYFCGENQSTHPEAACDASAVCGSSSLHEGHWKWDPGPQMRSMKHLKPLFYLW